MVTCAWADASPDGISTTSRNGSVEPSPKASVCRSQASYWVESVGNSELSRGPRRRSPLNTGMARTSSPTRAAASASGAWRVTKSAQRRMTPSRSGSGCASLAHGTREVAMRCPTAPTMAGWSVSADSTTAVTTSTTEYAMALTDGTSKMSSAARATITVAPAVRTARPMVPTACPAASTGSSPPTTKSFARPMTNRP